MTPITLENLKPKSPRELILGVLERDRRQAWNVKELAVEIGYSETTVRSVLKVLETEDVVDYRYHKQYRKTQFYGFKTEMNEHG